MFNFFPAKKEVAARCPTGFTWRETRRPLPPLNLSVLIALSKMEEQTVRRAAVLGHNPLSHRNTKQRIHRDKSKGKPIDKWWAALSKSHKLLTFGHATFTVLS